MISRPDRAPVASEPSPDAPDIGALDSADPHPVAAALRQAIAAGGGRITFADYMATALYHPEGGYYLQADRRPGRAGDFLTAPEAHPFFGRTLARQVVEYRERLGRPRPFVVREDGAGTGVLAFDVISGLADEAPEALDGLRYRLVEPNPHRRAEALAALAGSGFGGVVEATAPDAIEPFEGVALANEVADALPVHRLVSRDGALREGWVVRHGDGFGEEEGPLSPAMAAFDPAAYLARVGVVPKEGDRFDLSPAAAVWIAGVARSIRRGYAVVVDYGYQAATLYRDHRLRGTVRAHRRHAVTDDPFGAPGREDLTAHVDFTLLAEAAGREGMAPAGFTTQAAFLASLGLGDLLVRLGEDPGTTPAAYYAAQAAILRLVDPGGMGRFGVLVLAKDAPVEPPLRAFGVRL
jgi:SAM-dependent MidA family methyltransferase